MTSYENRSSWTSDLSSSHLSTGSSAAGLSTGSISTAEFLETASTLPPSHRPLHSDFTVPTSNLRHLQGSPPPMIDPSPPIQQPQEEQFQSPPRRFIIFGQTQRNNYAAVSHGAAWTEQSNEPLTTTTPLHNASSSSSSYASSPERTFTTPPPSSPPPPRVLLVSPLTPTTPIAPTKHYHHRRHLHGKIIRPHETVHAQSLLLGLAFAAVWSPSNVMAPNLTEMANTFDFDEVQRDLYLGSYCALATGVLSFPLSALIGFLSDTVHRQRLFCITIAGGAVSAIGTGLCTNFSALFALRLLNGGFMSGSVPVAFSFLGDLFSRNERNAASSGLTAMMGLGIIAGQVYAGVVGSRQGWSHAFFVSGIVTFVLALLCACLVQEPIRGGKEQVLQTMLSQGTRYERKLTLKGFTRACWHNKSNAILLWQGFFSSLPWGIIFVFLNDYLSQERGFSVPDATYLVLLFGLGCAAGGVLGGYWGQMVQSYNRAYLPLFMSATTALGIVPFLVLLNSHFTNAHGIPGILCSVLGGLIASLPAVNVRPCLINVNPPETRGASLTAANLLISLGRGVGPSCVTLMGSIWKVNRQFSFSCALVVFWLVSAVQLLFLARTLPKDQDAMEAELALYAEQAISQAQQQQQQQQQTTMLQPSPLPSPQRGTSEESIVSIEERMTSFDGLAAQESLAYLRQGLQELRTEVLEGKLNPFSCGKKTANEDSSSSNSDEDDGSINGDIIQRRELWVQQQRQMQDTGLSSLRDNGHPDETTPLL